jgi:hypothetical protein
VGGVELASSIVLRPEKGGLNEVDWNESRSKEVALKEWIGRRGFERARL